MADSDFGNSDFYKMFYAGEQYAEAKEFQRETGWNMLWGSDSQGLNGDTWIVYRDVADLPRYLQDYARKMEQHENKQRPIDKIIADANIRSYERSGDGQHQEKELIELG